MLIISLLTSAFTTKLKKWQTLKVEEEKERMRANLLRAVSHDLRSPLTTIYGASSAILENGKSLTEEQKTKMISGIKEDSEWLIRMVKNLLSITRIDSGKVKTYATIIKAVWREYPDEGSIKKLQVNMANIRKKFGAQPGESSLIVNELGVGYRMDGDK